MGMLINPGELAHLRSIYPLLEIAPLTSQEERLLYSYLKGMAITDAAEAVGMTKRAGQQFLYRPSTQALIDYLRQQARRDVNITQESLVAMLLESRAKAATANEEIMAVREIAKIMGLNHSDKLAERRQNNDDVRVRNELSKKDLARMSDDELYSVIDGEFDSLDPEAHE